MNTHVEVSESLIVGERLRRQHLLDPVSSYAYVDFLRLMQPAAPPYFSRPGNPPVLEARTCFTDADLTERLRRNRTLVKGRFLSGNVGYVFADQLALYATAFRRPMTEFNYVQQLVLDTVQRTGPVTIHQIKEETGFLSKQIVPALHRLQQAFLVYEDQVDSDWERGWYDFSAEWPSVELTGVDPMEALATVLGTFLQVHVFATLRQFADWSGMPLRTVKSAIPYMENNRSIRRAAMDNGEEGWMFGEISDVDHGSVASIAMLTRSDMLVRAAKTELKNRFPGREILRYLLIDGRFLGAVVGHWRIGPHDVEDVELLLPKRDGDRRKDEILEIIAQTYHPPYSRILKYMGSPI